MTLVEIEQEGIFLSVIDEVFVSSWFSIRILLLASLKLIVIRVYHDPHGYSFHSVVKKLL